VFRNLLDNALKYTPAGGRVYWTVSAGVDTVCCLIGDSGQGVEGDQLPHVFERFYRGDKSRSRDVAGSGLGLAIVKSIVEAYGGSISLESAGKEQGTLVTVLLPYNHADQGRGDRAPVR
jgi:signal transduction histidine kinase